MKYIVHKPFEGTALCGKICLPVTTELESKNGILYRDGDAICAACCENAHQFFARNDDGHGMERGRLTQAIQRQLSKRDKGYQDRWDKVWSYPVCRPFKRSDYNDYWLWNHDFFNADIDALRSIAKLVGAKEGK